MKLKATFYYTGSGSGPTFRTVEVAGIHLPRKAGSTFRHYYGDGNRKLTIYGMEITAGALPMFKSFHVEKCSGLVIKLVGEDQVCGDTFNPTTSIAEELGRLLDRANQEGV